MFLLGAAGFALAGLLQAKGYLNHALPAMALGLVGLVVLARTPGIQIARRRFVTAAIIFLGLIQLYPMASIRPIPGLAEAVERAAPANPTVLTLGPDLSTGHPLVRHVHGRWVGSGPALFVAAGARRSLARPQEGATRRRLEEYYLGDIDGFVVDVARARPDVVLVDARPTVAWLRDEPAIREAMRPYRRAARASDVEVWVRR
jgi:hypothetical protein